MSSAPVSYTNLDVYKRQSCDKGCLIFHTVAEDVLQRFDLLKIHSGPVSYTHLDVYKRQHGGQRNGSQERHHVQDGGFPGGDRKDADCCPG